MAHYGTSTADLVREAMMETRELVRIEVKLATAEVKTNLRQAQAAAVAFGMAAALALVGLTLFIVAIPLAFASPVIAALVTGAIFFALAAALALVGYYLVPKKPLALTRHSAAHELAELKEAL